MADAQDTQRHFLASLAYRFQAAVRDAPARFGDFEAGHGVRTPAEIVRHMTHVLRYAHHRLAAGAAVDSPSVLPFAGEVRRFHEALALLDRDLVDGEDPQEETLLRLLQGPLSDAMTHVGQLAMLRRMAGSPIRGQNFFAADIEKGRVGEDQRLP